MHNKIKPKLLFAIFTTLSAVIAIIFILTLFYVRKSQTGRTYLQDGWDIVRNDITYNENSLSEFHFPISQANDTIILSTTLPEFNKEPITLSVPVDHSTIMVTVDGHTVYEYGRDLYEENILVGSGYHWIQLPMDASNKQIRIELVATEDNSYSRIHDIYYEASDVVYHNFFLDQYPALYTCIFLIGFGFLILLIATFMMFYNRSSIRLIYIALFTILISVWFGFNYRLVQLVTVNYSINTTIEYIALYLAQIPISLFFREVYSETKTKRRILTGYVIVGIAFVLISFGLHAVNRLHLTQSLYFYQATIVTEVLFILFSAIRALKRKTKEDRLIFLGLVLLTSFVIMDLVRFWFEKFASGLFTLPIRSFMPFGIILFVISLLFSYLYYTFRNVTIKAENELLKKLAYTDMLTGLSNRTRMDEYMEELTTANLDPEQKSTYAIINMDLNRLKNINDTFGHETGDEYLKRFANLLSHSFSKFGEVGRIGGDEFLAILPNITKEVCEYLIATLVKELEQDNVKFPTNPLSFSYGICYSDEFSNASANKLYRLADYRMYEMKRRFKNHNHQEEEEGQDEYFN